MKTYLFDLDDTLIDTKIYAQLYPSILVMIERKTGLRGKSLDQKAAELGLKKNKHGRWDSGDLCRELGMLEEYYQELEKMIEIVLALHDSVQEVFQALKEKNREKGKSETSEKKGQSGKIGIVSNSMLRTINLYLNKYQLAKTVDFIFSSDLAGCRKDKEKYWSLLIKKEKLNPQDCLVIGDDEVEDVEIPQRLGFKTFHLSDPSQLKEVLKLM